MQEITGLCTTSDYTSKHDKEKEIREKFDPKEGAKQVIEAIKRAHKKNQSEIQAEIRKELEYLRIQKQLGMKMHDQIRRSIEKLRELGYENIDEIEKWFK